MKGKRRKVITLKDKYGAQYCKQRGHEIFKVKLFISIHVVVLIFDVFLAWRNF